MYGVINKSIQNLVVENYGEEIWNKVLLNSNLKESYFLSTEIYDDEITYTIVQSIAELLNVSVKEVFNLFGEYWILKTSVEKYAQLLNAGGNSLKEFLINLPFFHTRIALMYPQMTFPEFKVVEQNDKSLSIHYYSKRIGLHEFLRGAFMGLSKHFNEKIDIDLRQSRDDGFKSDFFKITWIK